jgi:peptidoglycan/xylan/chitin deacetylase (PgdA/CDA1 family)
MKRISLIFITVIVMSILLIAMIGKGEQIIVFEREKTIVEIDPSKPIVAFTFDDGPNREYTGKILDILYKNKSVATFFINGKNIEGNEKLLKKMVAEGNELANHTYNHYDLTTLTSQQVIDEVNNTQSSLEKVLPGYKLRYVRPPYGIYNDAVLAAIPYPIILWNLDTGDWNEPDSEKTYQKVMENIKYGDVVIFHDSSNSTVDAIAKIVPALKERGFQLVTLSQLYDCLKENPQAHQIFQ